MFSIHKLSKFNILMNIQLWRLILYNLFLTNSYCYTRHNENYSFRCKINLNIFKVNIILTVRQFPSLNSFQRSAFSEIIIFYFASSGSVFHLRPLSIAHCWDREKQLHWEIIVISIQQHYISSYRSSRLNVLFIK